MTSATNTISAGSTGARLPLGGLLALAMAAFITLLTEILPSGLLPQMAESLGQSEALIGQLVTVYAVGSLLAAIPLTIATQNWRRRTLLLIAIGGFAVVNTVTAISDSYVVTLVARFVAGMSAGLLWALAAGYAARMVPEHLQGRAIAIAMVGAPLALSLGIPAGTLLGTILGWRWTFGVMSGLTVLLVFWVLAKVPDFPGQKRGQEFGLKTVFVLPGLRPVLFVVFAYVLAHNTLYTYIAPFLAPAGIKDRTDAVLLIFGIASLFGIWITGVLIDRWLRELVLASIALFGLSALALGVAGTMPEVVYGAVAVWGLAFGGVGTLFQAASAKAAGNAADVAQSMLVTTWNLAIAGGGVVGGLLLGSFGVATFPWVLAALLAVTFVVAWSAKSDGFRAVTPR
ncbi:MFS transporter [Bosea sp. Tri-44]|uniref:MFS transporter n=1 Tax=Bosea sp. Tri-44 TaxID=1972137 RepID=UPI00100F6F65|nr:MFS transporter [Bosea sp. Tri-44]RXT48221.1 MFS transporter [Bosea sp. Tri-44]